MSEISDNRLTHLKTVVTELCGMCHLFKREFDAEIARPVREFSERGATAMREGRESSLKALMALNAYAQNCLDNGFDTRVIIEMIQFETQFKMPEKASTKQ